MKTNKFEEILRRKLESLTPDFQEKEWSKFQTFQQHATPSFWQSYGHWLGYAVAVTTTVVMVMLYVGQSRQNEALLREMQALRQQMKVVSDSAVTWRGAEVQTAFAPVEKKEKSENGISASSAEPLIRKSLRTDEENRAPLTRTPRSIVAEAKLPDRKLAPTGYPVPEKALRKTVAEGIPTSSVKDRFAKNSAADASKMNIRPSSVTEKSVTSQRSVPATEAPSDNADADYAERTSLGDAAPLERIQLSEKLEFAFRPLASRIPRSVGKSVKKTVEKSREEKLAAHEAIAKAESTTKPEKLAGDESLLPKFGLNLPYRVGLTQRWEGRAKAFGLQSEVILGKNWALQAGLAWQKLPNQRFLNEQKFKDSMKEDFRRKNDKHVPPGYEVYGIETHTTITQIPLGVTYRKDLGGGFAYFAGLGTNLNLVARQELNFQFKRPSHDFGEENFARIVPVPFLNNLNVSFGLEKRWSPIVLQVSPLVNTRFKTFPYLKTHTNVGVRVRLLYEFGAKK